MKVVLFGANGATGRLLTGQMIDAGHSALAVTRRPREFPFTDPQLTVAAADVRDESTLAGVTDGADAVVSAIGVPFTRQSVDIFSVGTRNIVTAMRQTGTQRLVVASSTGAHPYPHRQNASLSFRIFGPLIARTVGKTVYDDTQRMECARCSSEPASAVAEADEDLAHTFWPPQHFGSAVAAEVQTTGLGCC